MRPSQTYCAEAKFELCSALSPLRPRRQHDQALVHDSHALAGHIQAGPIRELAIMHATGDHMEALLGRVGIKGEDVALAVAECGYHGGLGKQRLGGQRGSDPALRFLVRQITQVVRDGAATLAGPYLTAHQAETDAVLGVHRQHRVQQHPAAVTLANLPEPAPALCSGCEVDLAGVLDRQNMAAFPAADVPSLQLSITRSVVTLALPRKRLNCTSRPRMPFASRRRQTSLRATMHSTSAAPLSRRRSPNRPNDQSICASISTPLPKPKCRNRNHMNSRFWNPPDLTRVNPSHQMCACPSANAGTHTPRPIGETLVLDIFCNNSDRDYGSLRSQGRHRTMSLPLTPANRRSSPAAPAGVADPSRG